MFNKPIKDMNFDELREAFQVLYDAFARQSREYNDLLQNLDFDNFTPAVSKAINSTVSDEKLGQIEESVIEQTAQKISTVVSSQQNLENAIVVDSVSDLSGKDISQIYVIHKKNGASEYYYWNNYSGKWEIFNDGTIYTLFEQTAKGFKFKGNVIVGGTIEGIDLKGSTLETARTSITDMYVKIRTDGDYTALIDMGGLGKIVANPSYGDNSISAVEVSANSAQALVLSGKKIIIDADSVEGAGLPLVFS